MTDLNDFNFNNAVRAFEYHREDAYETFPDDTPIAYCEACGRPLYVGDTAYKVCKVYLCEQCCEIQILRN